MKVLSKHSLGGTTINAKIEIRTKYKRLSFQTQGAIKTQAIVEARFLGKFWIHLPDCTTSHPTRLNAVRNQKAVSD